MQQRGEQGEVEGWQVLRRGSIGEQEGLEGEGRHERERVQREDSKGHRVRDAEIGVGGGGGGESVVVDEREAGRRVGDDENRSRGEFVRQRDGVFGTRPPRVDGRKRERTRFEIG